MAQRLVVPALLLAVSSFGQARAALEDPGLVQEALERLMLNRTTIIIAHRLRSMLTALGIAVGIAAVVMLTAIGSGIHQFVLSEFTQFGTNLVSVSPGKKSTFGISGATVSTVRPLTIADAVSLSKLENIIAVVPVIQGNARIEAEYKQRRTNVIGVGAAVPEVWKIKTISGRFLPAGEQGNPRAFAVLGDKLSSELFGTNSPLGKRIRIGSDRYRVIGVMEKKGQMVGFDMDDTLYIPAAKALELFNRESLVEINVLYQSSIAVAAVQNCDLMLVFGSSLVVYPAAELPMIALSQGARLVIVNLEATTFDTMATVNVRAKLGEFAKTALAAFL